MLRSVFITLFFPFRGLDVGDNLSGQLTPSLGSFFKTRKMKKYSRITKNSIKVFIFAHLAIFVYINIMSLAPYNGWLINNEAISNFLISMFVFCVSGLLFVYSFGLLLVKYQKDSWVAGIPLVISSVTWLLVLFLLPFLNLPFRFHQKDYENSAKIVIRSQGENKIALPEEYRHTSVTGGVVLIYGRVFYMQSIGMMGEYGPGYLYDPSNVPERVCTKSSGIFLVPNWYWCTLDWSIVW